MDYSQYFLVGSDMVHHCIAEFLTCPVNLEMFILFRDHFFGMPDRRRVNARRKLPIRSGCSSFQRGLSREDDCFTNVTCQATWF